MNSSALRILDANANRAREALRVMEDYCRFHLNCQEICGALKTLRHDLTAAIGKWADRGMLFRDTPGDVGTVTKTETELRRADMAAVVTAAGKRLGEALRTIEEYLKTLSPADAGAVEGIRYRFYDLEMRIARTLRPAERFAGVDLYVLITESVCKRPWLEVAEAAIAGGADCLQLREKALEGGELLRRARMLVGLCREREVLCVINDRPDVALAADADGVHLGQGDLPVIEARKLLGLEKIVGVSTHNLEQARQAMMDGADYLGVGPVFRSSTKARDFLPGLDFVRQAVEQISLPAVAIAGITEENIEQVLATGVQAVAVTAAVAGCDDPRGVTERMKLKIAARAKLVGQTFLSAQQEASASPGKGGVDILVCPPNASPQQKPSQPPTGGVDILVCPTNLSEPKFTAYGRRLPHWRLEGATYFITFRVGEGELTPGERTAILEHIRSGDRKFYTLIAVVVMPDHVHILLRPNDDVDLARIMKGTKGVTSRKVNDLRGVRGVLWQDESWDRVMRNQAELDEKLEYCMNNAVKRGLVVDPWDYPWWFYQPDRE